MVSLQKKRVVVVGGGTGTHTVLTGLKHYTDHIDLTAIVAMTDSGGSTGRLRDEFGYLPVGDVRMALVALAQGGEADDALIRTLFLHRFKTDGDVSGHNFGNLFLVALTDILGSEELAIEAASRILRVCGRVLPVTHEKIELVAHYDDGSSVVGEHAIDEPTPQFFDKKIVALETRPQASIHGRAKEALLNADVIIFGPGDLYTSVLANCVVPGFSEALKRSRGTMMYISNLMTKRGQTTGMGLQAHVETLATFSGRFPDYVFINTTALPDDLLRRYGKEGEYPVLLDYETLECRYVTRDFLAYEEVKKPTGDILKRSLIRHDPEKLAEALMDSIMYIGKDNVIL